MQVDPKYLRKHYAELSDEALLEIDRADLVEVAQQCYDEELGRRDLAPKRGVRRAAEMPEPSFRATEGPDEEEVETEAEPFQAGEKPDWLDEGAEVYSAVVRPGMADAPDVANARDVLEDAGIPCYLETVEIPREERTAPPPTQRLRVMVPGELNMRATSVLDRDIFNPEFEAQWKTHLETLPDEDLRAMDPEVVFCGLFDRIERVTRAYEEEMTRRGLGLLKSGNV